MKTPVVIATVLTIAVAGAAPAVAATGAKDSNDHPQRLVANHNELLVISGEPT